MKNHEYAESMSADDERFDRLADGGLPAHQYRALLASLDDEPGGWRKCALAFLEAQALAHDLSGLSQSKPHEAIVAKPTNTRQQARATWKNISLALAMAASFLAAVAVGILWPQFFREHGKERVVAGNLNNHTPIESPLVETSGDRYQVLRPVGNVKLVMDGQDGGGSAGQVPVYEVGADLEAVLASDDEAALGPDLLDVFRQIGYEVRHEQQFVPAPLEDGRQVVVPVQEYEIRPVSRTY